MQPDEPLNQQEQDEINQLLTHGIPVGDDEEIPDYLPVSSAAELHGFLTAIVSGPEVLPPSVWLPEILEEGREPGFSAEAATRVVELAFRQMNAIANTLMEAPEDFFPLKSILPLDDGEQEILAPWCMGYVRAYQLASEAWIDVLGEPEPLEHPLSAIMLFGTGLWLDMQESLEIPENEIDSFFAWMEEKIPEDARAIHAIFLEERAPMGSPVSPIGEGFVEPVAPVRRDEPKVGRNDPCPCGSGRKYKKCCLQ